MLHSFPISLWLLPVLLSLILVVFANRNQSSQCILLRWRRVISVNKFPRGTKFTDIMASSKEKEHRSGDSLTVEPTVVRGEHAVLSEETSQDDYFDVDIDELKGQLGIDQIMQS